MGEYGNNPGDLLAGVSRLGSLGTDYWNGDGPEWEEPLQHIAAPEREEREPHLPGDTPPPDVTPPEPTVVKPDYNARAIIYAHDPGQQNSVTTQYLDRSGHPVHGDRSWYSSTATAPTMSPGATTATVILFLP